VSGGVCGGEEKRQDKVLPLERKELLGQLLLDEIVTRYDEKNRR
ncbi:hypothetical protein, partial [Salmonella enterica]